MYCVFEITHVKHRLGKVQVAVVTNTFRQVLRTRFTGHILLAGTLDDQKSQFNP